MKVLMISLISVLVFSCANNPTTMRDRVESCMFRLVEQQGIAPLEAQNACKRLYYRELQQEAIYLEPRQGIEKTK
jgi:hypothetical protein